MSDHDATLLCGASSCGAWESRGAPHMAGPSLLPPLFVTWQPGPVPRRKGAPLGLKNMGNTCYLKPSSVSVEGGNRLETTRKGSQVDRVFWECPNPKVLGLQKVAANEHIAGMLNAVENSVENGHRVWEARVQQGFRSAKFCKIELPNAWRWKGRQASQGNEQGKPVRTAVLSTSMPTFRGTATANAGYVAGGVSQEMEQAEANFRVPDVPAFDKLIKHPLTLVSFVPKELALFFAGAVAGAAGKTVTAPLDRVKLLMQDWMCKCMGYEWRRKVAGRGLDP